ncbi:cation-transporting P-type ATPase, partial [Fusobacterium nucleatum]
MKHFTKSKKQLFREFETTSTGLIDEEVQKRRKKYG